VPSKDLLFDCVGGNTRADSKTLACGNHAMAKFRAGKCCRSQDKIHDVVCMLRFISRTTEYGSSVR